MSIKTTLWKVGAKPTQLVESMLVREQLLEEMIVSSPSLLAEEWMLIGRQEDTGFGSRIDLLAIAPDASLALIELKRDRTPRTVVAQAIDYATWVERLTPEAIASIYGRFLPGRSLADDFFTRYGQRLDEDQLNQSHQIIIVAGSLDSSTERIVGYLADKGIAINVLCFQVFAHGDDQFISHSWLLDPVETQASSASVMPKEKAEAWNGEFYCSFGVSGARSWEDALEFGFICGGGGAWYSRTLNMLSAGDRVWVNVPGRGYVGVGRVIGKSQPASSFMISTPNGEMSILEVAKRGHYHAEFADDLESCEYFVPIRWLDTVPLDRAIREIGLFGIQHTVCAPRSSKWRSTVERLMAVFPGYNADQQERR